MYSSHSVVFDCCLSESWMLITPTRSSFFFVTTLYSSIYHLFSPRTLIAEQKVASGAIIEGNNIGTNNHWGMCDYRGLCTMTAWNTTAEANLDKPLVDWGWGDTLEYRKEGTTAWTVTFVVVFLGTPEVCITPFFSQIHNCMTLHTSYQLLALWSPEQLQ